jgi:hypothetical protein
LVPSPFGVKALGTKISPHGDLDTKTITVSELLHPLAEAPETTYEVVMAGDAIGEAQVLQLNPVVGSQV